MNTATLVIVLIVLIPIYTYIISKIVSFGCVTGMLLAFSQFKQNQERNNGTIKASKLPG